MATDTYKSYIGVGKVKARATATPNAGLREVGNVSALTVQHELDVKRQQDFTRLGGGTLKKVERITQVNLNTTWLSFSAANLAVATAGTATTVAAGSVQDEVIKGYRDGTVLLAHPPKTITAVTNSAGTTTYDAVNADGVGDYERTPSGLYFPAASEIVDGADLKVDYQYDAYDNIEAGTKTSSLLYVVFEGLNEAESGDPVIVEFWRASFPSADELALIGDDFGELAFQAEALKDPSKGAGVSAYYRVRKVNPA